MSWLRLDDGFSDHPKLLELSSADRWTWIEVLCYCARYRTGGHLPARIRSKIPRATPAFIVRALELGLLDEDEDGALEVHDWKVYNGALESLANRKKRKRMRDAGVPENEVLRQAPYPDDLDFSNTRLAQAEGLPDIRGVLRDVPGGDPRGASTRARYPQPQPQENYRSEKTSVVEGSAWPASLRHAERVIWDELRADERKAVMQAHSASTGARLVRGTHGVGFVLDPLGVDPVDRNEAPAGFDGRATPSAFLAAWSARRAKQASE